MTKFFCNGDSIKDPEDIIPSLGAQEKHWRKGRSAYELAHRWMSAGGIPAAVSEVLKTQPVLAGVRMIEGHFERSTKIPGRGKASQTDLLVICDAPKGRVVLGVEGKVDETLGPLVCEWNDGGANKQSRLTGLLNLLSIDKIVADGLRYQLLHRTAAALIEARAISADRAVMLVHSFDPNHAWFGDFYRFSEHLGTPCPEPGRLSSWKNLGGTSLSIGWCADRVSM